MKTTVQKSDFGKLPDGKTAERFTLSNRHGVVIKITNYGTIITEIHVPDRNGKTADVALGFDNLEQYLKGHPYFGATVGRVANRIAKGKFTLEGKTYSLAINNGPNHLHGGLKAFDKVLWKAEPQEGASVKFSYTSPDGEEGYPGKVDATVTMSLTDANELRIDYLATTDKSTPVNLTNHSYFNLAASGDVLGHELMIAADNYTVTDSTLIPTGEIKPVKGTALDFTKPKAIGADFSQLTGDPKGYDDNFIINNGGKSLTFTARAREPKSGRVLEVFTTEPGVQLYTGNFLDGSLKGKNGVIYSRHTGFCLETQHFADSVNHANFPSTILRAGQTYKQTTIYKFTTD